MPAPDFLTFDVEQWYMVNYDGDVDEAHARLPSRLDWEIDRLLAICDDTRVRATTFWVGRLAAERPDLVRKWQREGHEIASHGYNHGLVHRMTPEAFREDLRRSIRTLEDCTGTRVQGYRAPSWSVDTPSLPWFYRVLEEEGIAYSSSVYPARTYLFGIEGFPERIQRPEIDGARVAVYEVPQVLTRVLGRKIGFSGGFFLRLFPAWYIEKMLARANREGTPVFIYLHPREIDPQAPHLPLKGIDRLVQYWNIAGTEAKLRRLLGCGQFQFVTMGDYIRALADNTREGTQRPAPGQP